MPLDAEALRRLFPILQRQVYGHPLVYLDNAATTQKPDRVLQAMLHALQSSNANIHRGVHSLSVEMTEAYEKARHQVAAFLGIQKPSEVLFTNGATAALNLLANSLPPLLCQKGDAIVLSEREHHSNIVPWQLAAQRLGIEIRKWPLRQDGTLALEDLKSLLGDGRVRVVSVGHVSNVLGVVADIPPIAELVHRQGAILVVDGAQGVKHGIVDIPSLQCDAYAFSGHKIYGPTGIGALWVRGDLLERMPPWQGGGEMIESVSFEKTTFAKPPYRFEAGTPPYIQAIGLASALEWYQGLDRIAIEAYERALMTEAYERLSAIPGITFYGYNPSNAAILSFNVEDVHPSDLGTLLDKMGIAVRTGTHCAEPLMNAYGIRGTTRASFALYNTHKEVDTLVKGVQRAVSMLR